MKAVVGKYTSAANLRAHAMQSPILVQRGFFVCPNQAALTVGLTGHCVWTWAKRQVTSYGFPLRVVKHRGHIFIAEEDVRVLERVNRDFPLARGGPGDQKRREQMKQFAERLRAAMMPSR
jgi:hypothetical protein